MDWRIREYDDVPSTQDIARQLARDGEPEGTVVVADVQHAGRGRGGSKWYSPRSTGLWVTCLLRPVFPPDMLPILPLLVSVSISRAVEKTIDSPVAIKWPNDIQIGGRKLAGVLCEAESAQDGAPSFVLAGFGLNVSEPEGGFPDQITDIATSLETATGKHFEKTRLLETILDMLADYYDELSNGRSADIIEQVSRRDVLAGSLVRVRVGNREISGESRGISERGGLLVRETSGDLTELISGEVIEYSST
jgi:BirA family biotin operon repressor/biotin-[acetyl-CoA-carboxylase] ligase